MKSQLLKSCYVCTSTISIKDVLCKACIADPYAIEDARRISADARNLTIFKLLYRKKFAEIVNANTGRFWDKKFTIELTLNEQDDMTKDKINELAICIPSNTKTLLDLGFGQGYLEEKLNKKNKNIKITGVDISKQAVNRANKKLHGQYLLGDILHIRNHVKNVNFDVITAIEVIEHIPPSKIINFLNDVNLLLKPGGTFLISTPLNEHLRTAKSNPSSHLRDYSIPTIKMEFKLSGFKIMEHKTFYAFKKWYKLKKILARIFPNHWEPNNVVIKAIKI